MATSNQPRLVLCYLYRAGAHPVVKDGDLLIHNAAVLTPYDRDEVRLYKAAIIELIAAGGVVDDFRWHHSIDQPEHRARALGGQHSTPSLTDACERQIAVEEPGVAMQREIVEITQARERGEFQPYW